MPLSRSLATLGALALAACGGAASSGPSATTGTSPAVTAVGAPAGTAATATIGATGGSLSSSDGKLTLVVPPGALPASTTIGIQPVANHAPGGIGHAYRLTPDGLRFAVPVTLELPFEQADIAGSSTRALRVAVQDAQGRWGVLRAATVDAVARKVRLTTSHFSDYSMVIGWQLRPGSATVAPGQSVAFAVRMCAPASVPGDEDLVGLLAACTETLEPNAVANLEWAVNAIRGGNATVGTVTSSGVYTAPASAPSPNVVAVSAEMSFEGDKDLLVANVTVTSAGYGGTVVFSGRSSDSTGSYTFAGSAQLSFIKDPATTLFQLVPGESSVRFDTWDFTSSQLVCRLAAAATTPFASVGSLTLLDALKSYAWVAVVQAQGRENCTWVATGERIVRDAFPATMLGTQQGQTPGFLPYTDAAQLEGRNVIDESSAGGSLHVENAWTLVRVP